MNGYSNVTTMDSESGYRLVQLASGAFSVRSLAHHETFHPVIGPEAEATALYVRQLRLLERWQRHHGPFVIWDVGLGAAANPITILRAARETPLEIVIKSFDQTFEPLGFALDHVAALPYLEGYETPLHNLVTKGEVSFANGASNVHWSALLGDFPSAIRRTEAARWPKPHAVLFDAYSPARNPEMWTQPLFARLYSLLDQRRPCALPTYSRSTMLRVSLLLAGFFVGAGHATGEKEETTIAANHRELIAEPLDKVWLNRARQSTSADPLWEPVYRQAPLSPETLIRLEQHPQFL